MYSLQTLQCLGLRTEPVKNRDPAAATIAEIEEESDCCLEAIHS